MKIFFSELEKGKFTILDEVREATQTKYCPYLKYWCRFRCDLASRARGTCSIKLDLALGRGGDQVAIKQPNGKVKFFGGKTNPVEKRTRVRARVISHALKELVVESEKVIYYGT